MSRLPPEDPSPVSPRNQLSDHGGHHSWSISFGLKFDDDDKAVIFEKMRRENYPTPEAYDAAIKQRKWQKKRIAYFESILHHITRKIYQDEESYRTPDLWNQLIRISSEAYKDNLFAWIKDETLQIAQLIARR